VTLSNDIIAIINPNLNSIIYFLFKSTIWYGGRHLLKRIIKLTIYINLRVKYVFISCGLTDLFFTPCGSFCITYSTLVLVKDEDSTSVQKLTIVRVSATKQYILKVNTCSRCYISLRSRLRLWCVHATSVPCQTMCFLKKKLKAFINEKKKKKKKTKLWVV
jgi:hypothetical protein